MEEYKSNSDKSKKAALQQPETPKPRPQKVISGKAKLKKQSSGKIKELFVASEASNVRDYIIYDIIIPTIKDTLYNVFVNGLSMTLFGNTKGGRRGDSGSHVSYVKYYDDRDRYDRNSYAPSYRSRTDYNYRDVVVDTKAEAEELLERLAEMIDAYGIASILDLYDMVGLKTYNTDSNYGWTMSAIREARIVRDFNGWCLKMPRPQPIN